LSYTVYSGFGLFLIGIWSCCGALNTLDLFVYSIFGLVVVAFAMKILSWNCRGLTRPSVIRSLRALINKHSPDVIFLSETKTSPSAACPILHRLGFYSLAHVPPIGSKGGLLLAWRSGVDLECFVTNKHSISAWCYSDPPNNPWILSCVYGPPYNKTNTDFWKSLAGIGSDYSGPWLCIGDFNRILDQTEKYGGRPFSCSSNDLFRDFLNLHGLVDLGFSGSPFTWSNHRHGRHLIRERLDRDVASTQWIHLFSSFSVRHLLAHASDHLFLILNTATPNSNLPKPFRFEEFWSKDPSCHDVISSVWNPHVVGSSPFILAKKLKVTKTALKLWNSTQFGNIQQRISTLTCQLEAIQCSLHASSCHNEELEIRKSLDELYLHEETLWRNKSRETWLTCKDLNTRFFHTSTLIKRRRSSIDFLKSSTGAWITDRNTIGNCFSSHFSSLFTTSTPPCPDEFLSLFENSISLAENDTLCSIPSEQEIFDALSSIGSTKAPGPDGFTALFYKKYLSIIKDVVLGSVWDFFLKNHLLKEQNHTFIALIPKQLGPSTVHHFRPISLCNIIYKIISKILANRFKVLLHHFISPLQSAFVPTRNIQDNTILAHELLHTMKAKRGRGGLMAIKLDMEKAFDRMEWSFLFAILEKLGFRSTWSIITRPI
jgi:hypothetical protein